MNGGSVSSQRNEKTSVKHRSSNPFEGAFVELANFDNTDNTPSGNDRRTLRNSDPQSSETLSTSDLISAVGYAWNRARKPLSALVSKNDCKFKTEVIRGDGILNYSTDEETLRASNSAVDQPCSRNSNRRVNSSRLVQENLERLKVKQKIICPRPSCGYFSFWKMVLARSTVIEESYCLSSTEPSLGSIYRGVAERAHAKQKTQVDCVKIERETISNCCTSEFSMNTGNGSVPTNNIVHGQHINETDCNNLASVSHECENSTNDCRDGPHEHQKDQGVVTFDEAESSEVEISLPAKEIISPYALAKQEHAFAGAMSGIFVSLCLHPMDTIKTVVQSCHVDRKPVHDIGRSIIAERGIRGLYRGISSNIVTSAPISAVYTFTYESVKKSLIPLLPKEYHSLAHCTAGGCASIATSFIFTPSERIKQQMQIGSHYRNCWNAFIQIVEKGGLLSLYTGWGAVLCRNVPHSVIKFYTYESLKQIMLPPTKSDAQAQANLVATLVCGGLAGSMASLFTTPFDVVKTRLQTQIPGSMTLYSGVFNTLTDIGKQEGLKGLYRGLTPRLVMYMIQGALFFTSYESFKRLFSLELSQLSAHTFQHE